MKSLDSQNVDPCNVDARNQVSTNHVSSIKDCTNKDAVFAAAKAAVAQAQTIAICGHTSPDGDALGSGLALALGLKELYPDKKIVNLLADSKRPSLIYSFLAGIDEMVQASDYAETPDLFIACDLSVSHRLNDAEAICARSASRLILDHHPCQDPFAEISYIRPSACAAGIIIYEFLRYLGAVITPKIAQNLLCAIITDTGRFQYQNANPECFQAAAELVSLGASPCVVSQHIYENAQIGYLHLKAEVLKRITTFHNGEIAYSYATQADFTRLHVPLEEAEGLVDAVRTTRGSKIVLFLKESHDCSIRANLRSKSDIDISGVARFFGGGGHAKAAGFSLSGSVDDAFAQVLPKLEELLSTSEERA